MRPSRFVRPVVVLPLHAVLLVGACGVGACAPRARATHDVSLAGGLARLGVRDRLYSPLAYDGGGSALALAWARTGAASRVEVRAMHTDRALAAARGPSTRDEERAELGLTVLRPTGHLGPLALSAGALLDARAAFGRQRTELNVHEVVSGLGAVRPTMELTWTPAAGRRVSWRASVPVLAAVRRPYAPMGDDAVGGPLVTVVGPGRWRELEQTLDLRWPLGARATGALAYRLGLLADRGRPRQTAVDQLLLAGLAVRVRGRAR